MDSERVLVTKRRKDTGEEREGRRKIGMQLCIQARDNWGMARVMVWRVSHERTGSLYEGGRISGDVNKGEKVCDGTGKRGG